MAYDAAVDQGVDKVLCDIYEVFAVKKDIGWYVETGLLNRAAVSEIESTAMNAAVPKMNDFVDAMGVAPWVKAPILAEATWDRFVNNLYTFREAPEVRAAM